MRAIGRGAARTSSCALATAARPEHKATTRKMSAAPVMWIARAAGSGVASEQVGDRTDARPHPITSRRDHPAAPALDKYSLNRSLDWNRRQDSVQLGSTRDADRSQRGVPAAALGQFAKFSGEDVRWL